MPTIAPMGGWEGYGEALKRRVPHIALLGLTMGAMDALRAFPLLVDADLQRGFLDAVTVFLGSFVSAAPPIAAITYAERTSFAATHRAQTLLLAVIIAAPVASLLGVLMSVGIAGMGGSLSAEHEIAGLFLYQVWYSAMTGILAATYFTLWERVQTSSGRLRAVELERQGIEHRMVESRLNVMKARVDPEFLFRVIGDVQRLYRSDCDAAEQRLEDLIEYLRAALPQMRSGATTLGEEVRLAEAFVRLHEESFEGRLRADFDVDAALDGAQFPPLALLPLVDDALRRALQQAHPRLVLRVLASGNPGRLAVAVEDDCAQQRPAIAGEAALECHERAFIQFFGDGARVRRESGAAFGTRVLLEVEHGIATRAAG